MRTVVLGAVAGLLMALPASAGMVTKKVAYSTGGTKFEGVLVYDDSVGGKRPLVVMAPNWMGVTDSAVTKAKKLAGSKYVFFIADMYGVNNRPRDSKEAGKAAGAVRKNITMMRARINKAVDVGLSTGGSRVDGGKIAAIGFCFGGGNVLELARSGRGVKGVVSFHGDLIQREPKLGSNIKAKVLVLHGNDDPLSPKAHRDALEAEMVKAKTVDWQLISYGGAVHSFTDPGAKWKGRAEYNATVARRSFKAMNDFFAEIF